MKILLLIIYISGIINIFGFQIVDEENCEKNSCTKRELKKVIFEYIKKNNDIFKDERIFSIKVIDFDMKNLEDIVVGPGDTRIQKIKKSLKNLSENYSKISNKDYIKEFNKKSPNIKVLYLNYYKNGILEVIYPKNIYKKNLLELDKKYVKVRFNDITEKNIEDIKNKKNIIFNIPYSKINFSKPYILLEKLIYKNELNNFIFISPEKSYFDIIYKNKNFILKNGIVEPDLSKRSYILNEDNEEEKYVKPEWEDFINLLQKFIYKNENFKEKIWDVTKSELCYSNEYLKVSPENGKCSSKMIIKLPREDIKFKENSSEIQIMRKKYINNDGWNISEVNISENKDITLKKVKDIKGINYITFEDKNLGKFSKEIKLSEKALVSIEDDDIDELNYDEDIISKKNIVKNQNPNKENPKIIKFNGKEIKNSIIYEIMYRGYMFKLVGDENLYQNQEIKDLIVYLKSLEQYM